MASRSPSTLQNQRPFRASQRRFSSWVMAMRSDTPRLTLRPSMENTAQVWPGEVVKGSSDRALLAAPLSSRWSEEPTGASLRRKARMGSLPTMYWEVWSKLEMA